MATFGGDLLRILAHGVVGAGTNIGSQLLANYLQPDMLASTEAKKELIKGYLNTLSTGSTEEQEAVAPLLEKASGYTLPRARTGAVTSPEGAKLTMPETTPISDLAPGYKAQMGLVRPPTSKPEELLAGLLSRNITGTAADKPFGNILLNAMKPPRTARMGETEYLMSLSPAEREQAVQLIIAKKDPALAMFLGSKDGQDMITKFKSAGRPINASELLIEASKNPNLAAALGQAATSMQAQPKQVDVINPEAQLPKKATQGAIMGPRTTAPAPSPVAQEQRLLSSITEGLGKMQYTVPSEIREQQRQVVLQSVQSLNEIRATQGKPPINTTDLVENNFKIATKALQAQKDALGVDEYNRRVKALQERKSTILQSIGAK